jgi:S-adenosylmethionine:tRNA ribosyltransferase-isomerase
MGGIDLRSLKAELSIYYKTIFSLSQKALFMLVSALMGLDTMKAAYAHAIARAYRFYSYGDASLMLPA